jgi:hypothetical protein
MYVTIADKVPWPYGICALTKRLPVTLMFCYYGTFENERQLDAPLEFWQNLNLREIKQLSV